MPCIHKPWNTISMRICAGGPSWPTNRARTHCFMRAIEPVRPHRINLRTQHEHNGDSTSEREKYSQRLSHRQLKGSRGKLSPLFSGFCSELDGKPARTKDYHDCFLLPLGLSSYDHARLADTNIHKPSANVFASTRGDR